VSPPGDYACTDKGSCELGKPVCKSPDPCHGLHCGQPCTPKCDPQLDGGCPPPLKPMACDLLGHCSPAVTVMCMAIQPYVPCMGKVCNEPCTICDPMDPTCTEMPGPKACDASGTCTAGAVTCP
jgi:hypothetical protein